MNGIEELTRGWKSYITNAFIKSQASRWLEYMGRLKNVTITRMVRNRKIVGRRSKGRPKKRQ